MNEAVISHQLSLILHSMAWSKKRKAEELLQTTIFSPCFFSNSQPQNLRTAFLGISLSNICFAFFCPFLFLDVFQLATSLIWTIKTAIIQS